MWTRIWALAIKEFLVLLKDPKSRIVIIVPPIIQMLVFGYAVTYDLNEVRYAVYDQDASVASRRLLAKFEGSPTFSRVGAIDHDSQIDSWLNARQVLMVIRVDSRFEDDLLAGRPGKVQILIDGRNSNTALVALGYVRSLVNAFSATWAADHGGVQPPAELEIRSWFNPNLESRWFIVPGIVGMLMLVVTTMVTAMSVARERESGTFDQLLVTPLRRGEMLIGKALPGVVIGLFEATLVTLVAVFWFSVPLRGSLVVLYGGILIFLAAVVGMGLMVSSLAVTMQQALLGSFLFLVPAVILSGFTTPIENMPVAVQYVTYINPLRYFMAILRGVFLEQARWDVIIRQAWPLAIIAAATLSLAAWLFRKRTY